MHRFILAFEVIGEKIKVSDPDVVNQVVHVLKLKTGELLVLCDGKNGEAVCEIENIGKQAIGLKIVETRENKNESPVNVTLYCALLKRENFEWVVQKATEVGVKEIVPLITKRTVKLNLRQDRLEKIIKEAAEQSGRGIVPVLHTPMPFDEAVKSAAGMNVLLDSSGDTLVTKIHKSKAVNVWIGPEGGWTPEELEQAKNANFSIASLGALTLRAETAAIIASYLAGSQIEIPGLTPRVLTQ